MNNLPQWGCGLESAIDPLIVLKNRSGQIAFKPYTFVKIFNNRFSKCIIKALQFHVNISNYI